MVIVIGPYRIAVPALVSSPSLADTDVVLCHIRDAARIDAKANRPQPRLFSRLLAVAGDTVSTDVADGNDIPADRHVAWIHADVVGQTARSVHTQHIGLSATRRPISAKRTHTPSNRPSPAVKAMSTSRLPPSLFCRPGVWSVTYSDRRGLQLLPAVDRRMPRIYDGCGDATFSPATMSPRPRLSARNTSKPRRLRPTGKLASREARTSCVRNISVL